jgi:hypothetical protein
MSRWPRAHDGLTRTTVSMISTPGVIADAIRAAA